MGLGVGLIIANLLGAAFVPVPLVGKIYTCFLSVVLGYTGLNVAIRKRENCRIIALPAFFGGKDRAKDKANRASGTVQDFGYQRDYRRPDC